MQMIREVDLTGRRILTFPAVLPCKSISPVTLLTSLINMSRSICSYQSKDFTSQTKNAREAIRQIEILLIFFEEVLDQATSISGSVIFCLSELHFALQKLQFLLEDCTREGAKVWILMKSQFVESQFREVIRSVATVFDVVPLKIFDISSEVKELVELVSKHAKKVKFDVNSNDRCAMERVILILNQFENRFEPERCMIKRVLDYLEIKSWTDCDKEIRFLDGQIDFCYISGNEREVPLLSSLMALMCYCRGVIFDTLDYTGTDQPDSAKCGGGMFSCLNPEDFRCPISLELMTDPVTVSTGQTFDRSSIQKWLKSGNMLCPKTGEKLTSIELVPNSALKKLIQRFCEDNSILLGKSGKNNRDITRTKLAGSPAAGETLKFLAGFLAGRLTYGTDEQKNKAAYEVRLLAKSNIYNRSSLVEVGTIPPLLDLLTSTDESSQENAIAALLKLSKHSRGQKAIIESGGLNLIVMVLRKGLKLETRQIAAGTIFYLSAVDRYRKLIGAKHDAIPALVELIRDGKVSGKRNAIAAIFGLLLYHGNRERFLTAGIVPLLVDLVASSDKSDLIEDSLAVLAALAENIEGSVAILQTSALPLVMGLLQSSSISRAGKEPCVSILLSSCINGGTAVVSVVAKEASVMPPLYALLTAGTSNASKKARALIHMLHTFQESSSSGLATSAVLKETTAPPSIL
ncbi:hypothetical protein Nepgr_003133 [Nepenthes gracilis]|uniref:RING-type E3 ubiquitin transferase n=1 Tax=Nepenthes gracilis TaxID=150966 RepID=A0AAD3RZ16_NEPGR|nr:hypothetical protein Nepgr_003133 [Nepenthes gracilis]